MINMAKTTTRIGSHRNEHRALKGVIHVQAIFNNIITIVVDVWGQVLSWSSIGVCGFKGTRRGTPFVAQTVAENVIRTLMGWGM
jgi:ribosomal protein S11